MKPFAYRFTEHAARHGLMVDVVARTGSTNDDVKRLGSGGAPHGFTLVADAQDHGRGRLGREWVSAPGSQLLFSTLIRPRSLPPQRLGLLALGTAVAIAEVCPALQIKWPNDLLASDGRKVAGILAEAEWDQGTLRYVVLGVGLNVTGEPAVPGAASLEQLGAPTDRVQLGVQLIGRVLELADEVQVDPDRVLERWRARAHTLGKQVRIGKVAGTAVDIDSDGALLVDDGRGLQRILTGDVQLVG